MVVRTKVAFSLLLVGIAFGAVGLQAQDGRFRVLVPYFEPLEGAKDGFGKDASKELRTLISALATHEPIEEKQIKDEVKRFKMKIEELDCIRTRQLASQIGAQVALCASYTAGADGSWTVNAAFWDIASSEVFEVDQVTVGEKEAQRAAQHIFDQFDRYVQQIRAVGICQDYYGSKQWENALRNCDEALALNPGAISSRYLRGRILYEMGDNEGGLAELDKVLEVNPFHEEALQLAGYVAATVGQDDKARGYYGRYLDINPGNAAIRMNIAYDLAKAGDPVGAMDFIQVGIDVEPDNVALWEQFGGFAFAAALEAQQMAAMGTQEGGGLPPEATGYYRQAIEAYEKVFAGKGAETPVGHLRNIMAAYIQLDEAAAAIDVGERVLKTHAQEDQLWSMYADALQRANRLDDAITALGRVREINPSHPSASMRQGNWLIQAGRTVDAVEVLKTAVAGNAQQAEQAAKMVFADAYQNGYQKDRFQYAINGLTAAKQLPGLSAEMLNQLNFWHGFSLYSMAVKEQEPQTLASAKGTLPKFQEALGLLNKAGGYPASVNVNLPQLIGNANTFIEIQDAIIKRGR